MTTNDLEEMIWKESVMDCISYPGICPEGQEIMRNLSQRSWPPSRKWNPGPSECMQDVVYMNLFSKG
jgi:hypothetical protein